MESGMKLLNTKSLAATIDNINDALFFEKKIPAKSKSEAVMWIASRQGINGSYAGMPAPTKSDFKLIKLFTGERNASRAAVAHILGEESCRVMILLGTKNATAKKALKNSTDGMLSRIRAAEADGHSGGMYCCGTCTGSYWRHLIVGGLDDNERRLSAGLKELKKRRKGDGKWSRFPYYYTLLALDEIGQLEISKKNLVAEIRYASGGLERLLKRKPRNDKYDTRRRILAERILSKC